jgi:hypothetical protein
MPEIEPDEQDMTVYRAAGQGVFIKEAWVAARGPVASGRPEERPPAPVIAGRPRGSGGRRGRRRGQAGESEP